MKIFWILIFLIAAGTGGFFFHQYRKKKNEEQAPEAVIPGLKPKPGVIYKKLTTAQVSDTAKKAHNYLTSMVTDPRVNIALIADLLKLQKESLQAVNNDVITRFKRDLAGMVAGNATIKDHPDARKFIFVMEKITPLPRVLNLN